MRASTLVAGAGVLVVLHAAPAARATEQQDGEAPASGDVSADAPAAEALYRAGLARHAERDYAEAVALFARAHALDPRPEILFAWAQASRLSGDCATARALFDRFVATGPPPAQVEAAELAARRCVERSEAPPVVPAPPSVAVELEQAPAPAALPRGAGALRDGWARGLIAGGLISGTAGLSLVLLARSQAARVGVGEGTTYGQAEVRLSEARLRWRVGLGLGVAGGLAALAGAGRLVWLWWTPEGPAVALGGRY